jgi:hypothetical protein
MVHPMVHHMAKWMDGEFRGGVRRGAGLSPPPESGVFPGARPASRILIPWQWSMSYTLKRMLNREGVPALLAALT